jgi:hypothetical protein
MLIDVPATLHRTRAGILALGGEVDRFEIGPPATPTQLEAMQQRIGCEIPAALRQLFLEQTASVRLFWSVETHVLPKPFENDVVGGCDLSLEDLPGDLLNWSGWRAAFEDPSEHGLSPDLTVEDYEELFPVVADVSGDQIVVADPEKNPSDAVVYLNHESSEFNFVILAPTLEQFLNTWIALGCPGPGWEQLAPFIDTRTLELSLKTRHARAWLKALGTAV